MKDYKTILEGVVNIINTTEKSDIGFANICSYIGENCPELKESEDERIRKHLIKHFGNKSKTDWNGMPVDKIIAWLEKQGENNKWKPSKDEMDALYGLAYITNKMDDKKDKAITKLYQDLKREFFNGATYENMFPSSPVDSEINIEKEQQDKGWEELKHFNNSGWVIVEQKPAWSEYDEEFLLELSQCCDLNKTQVQWLLSIKDRVQSQQKHEWSKEDKETLNDIITSMTNLKDNATSDALRDIYNSKIDWLKSLRPQSTWKPSEEQLNALHWCVMNVGSTEHQILQELLEQLEKLKD